MTEKKGKILTTALELFASNGFDVTSTKKVAEAAGVSEGLIFRHFDNKKGLLQAIMDHGREKTELMLENILSHADPKAILHALLTLPFQMAEGEYHYWKLLYSLKWSADVYDEAMVASMRTALTQVFSDLAYDDPPSEADTVLLLMDGIATLVLLHRPTETTGIQQAILAKYGLTL